MWHFCIGTASHWYAELTRLSEFMRDVIALKPLSMCRQDTLPKRRTTSSIPSCTVLDVFDLHCLSRLPDSV